MTCILNFSTSSAAKIRKQHASAQTLLASLARGLNQIGRTEFKNKKDIQRVLLLIAISNLHMRTLVDQIECEETRARTIAQLDYIEERVEDVGKRAAIL